MDVDVEQPVVECVSLVQCGEMCECEICTKTCFLLILGRFFLFAVFCVLAWEWEMCGMGATSWFSRQFHLLALNCLAELFNPHFHRTVQRR